MTKPINEYTVDELSAKIEAIKSEREKTANALKKYEEELERRKQEVPLGVPLEDKALANLYNGYVFGFASEDSICVFDGRIKDYVEALQKLAKGEPISIKALVPLLKKGWVAMDKDKDYWYWYSGKPALKGTCWSLEGGFCNRIGCFNLKPAENWEDSLMECGL